MSDSRTSNPLQDVDVFERLYHVHKALDVHPLHVLNQMRRIRAEDPSLDWEYALYHFVFEYRDVELSEGFYAIRYVDDSIDGRINYVVCARKGAFAFPEHQDARYCVDSPMPTIKAIKDKGLNVMLPKVYVPCGGQSVA